MMMDDSERCIGCPRVVIYFWIYFTIVWITLYAYGQLEGNSFVKFLENFGE
jgi:hypothetical protein